MDEAIAQLANTLWEKAGRPEGRDMEFWLAAEKLVGTDHTRKTQEKPAESEALDGLHPPAFMGGD